MDNRVRDLEVLNQRQANLIYEVFEWHRANLRSGNHSTLNKNKMEVTKRKPWKQKGTGRARAGGFDSPIWVGGAVAHGPQPRNYSFSIPKKKLKQARIILFNRLVELNKVMEIETLPTYSKPSTKNANIFLRNFLGGFNTESDRLLVVYSSKEVDENFRLSCRNLKWVTFRDVESLSAVDFLNTDFMIITKEAKLYFDSNFLRLGNKEEVSGV
ncbi:MAG: 50S ribosomal protein L4 [Deltaproteobacteria bacterium]|nr:50S ribosomal protein L4 [Deltaproteobacteria bacterium]